MAMSIAAELSLPGAGRVGGCIGSRGCCRAAPASAGTPEMLPGSRAVFAARASCPLCRGRAVPVRRRPRATGPPAAPALTSKKVTLQPRDLISLPFVPGRRLKLVYPLSWFSRNGQSLCGGGLEACRNATNLSPQIAGDHPDNHTSDFRTEAEDEGSLDGRRLRQSRTAHAA